MAGFLQCAAPLALGTSSTPRSAALLRPVSAIQIPAAVSSIVFHPAGLNAGHLVDPVRGEESPARISAPGEFMPGGLRRLGNLTLAPLAQLRTNPAIPAYPDTVRTFEEARSISAVSFGSKLRGMPHVNGTQNPALEPAAISFAPIAPAACGLPAARAVTGASAEAWRRATVCLHHGGLLPAGLPGVDECFRPVAPHVAEPGQVHAAGVMEVARELPVQADTALPRLLPFTSDLAIACGYATVSPAEPAARDVVTAPAEAQAVAPGLVVFKGGLRASDMPIGFGFGSLMETAATPVSLPAALWTFDGVWAGETACPTLRTRTEVFGPLCVVSAVPNVAPVFEPQPLLAPAAPAIRGIESGATALGLRHIQVPAVDPADTRKRLLAFGPRRASANPRLPVIDHQPGPLALKVQLPKYWTPSAPAETPAVPARGKVRSIQASSPKRRAIPLPSWVQGLAAGVVLASLGWSGAFSSTRLKVAAGTSGNWIRHSIEDRATIASGDNFHGGLKRWQITGNATRGWLFDPEGFIRVGQLALYNPSLRMSDYKLEFLTQIERRSIGWAIRAKDPRNYYAVKLTVLEAGPLPVVALVRYPVMNGVPGRRIQTRIASIIHNDRPYRVEMEVRGNTYSASLEGQTIDAWTDDDLKSGGVGFFSDKGERARLYWMKISNNDDVLGHMCAMLGSART